MFAGLIGIMAAAMAASSAPSAPSAPTQVSPATVTAPATPVVDDPMKKIECRRMEETGTRLGSKRVCMAHQDWLEATREARTMTEQSQSRGGMVKTPGS